MKLFWIFISLVVFQRIAELIVAKRNERIARREGAVEFDRKGYKVIVAMHIAFLISIVAEYVFLNRTVNSHWIVLITLFLLAQILRYWAIASLGKHWNTKILVIPGSGLIRKGPYNYISHPNYIAVIIEIAALPLIFSCYITFLVFSVLNLLVLKRRIRIEEEALSTSSVN